MMNKTTIFAVILTMSLVLFAQANEKNMVAHNKVKFLTKLEAEEDIHYFFSQAEQIHPDLYFHITKEEVREWIKKEIDNIEDSISMNDFSRKMTMLANLIGDGHTNVSIYKGVKNSYLQNSTRLPFSVSFEGNDIYIVSSNNPKLQSNDKIMYINHLPVTDLLGLTKYVAGDTDLGKRKVLAKYFSYFLFVGYEFTDSISVTVFRNNQTKHDVTVKLLPSKPKSKQKKYEFNMAYDSVGVLTIRSFAGLNKGNYLQFLDSTFDQIDRTKLHHLVIDLRSNGGGNSNNGALLCKYIGIDKYRFNQKYRIKTSKPVKKYIRKTFIKWYLYPLYPFAFVFEMGRILLFKKNGVITDIKLNDSGIKPVDKSFKGVVYVATSALTYSAAADFVVAFRYANRGKVVGDTLGQPYAGYIDKVPIKLPYSRLNGWASFKEYEYIGADSSNRNNGIEPDVYIVLDELSPTDMVRAIIKQTTTPHNLH